MLTEPRYRFSDIVLSEEAKAALKELLSLQKNRKLIFDQWGLGAVFPDRKSFTVNLYGPSGTGKTMTAHALAAKLGKKLIIADYSELESKFVGETSKNIVRLFRQAEKNDAVLLFDEADALLSKRVTAMFSATDAGMNQTRNVLLKILDEYRGVVIFTTNFIRNFDQAFLRRISSHIRFEMPDQEMRERLWAHYIVPKFPLDGNRKEIIGGDPGRDRVGCLRRSAEDRSPGRHEAGAEGFLRRFCGGTGKDPRRPEGNEGISRVT